MRTSLGAGLLVVAALLPTAVAAANGRIVLVVQGQASALDEQLRRAAEQAARPVQLATLTFEELALTTACTSQNADCLQRIGKSLQAQSLVLAELAPPSHELRLRHVDVASGRELAHVQLKLPAAAEQWAPLLFSAVRELFGSQPAAPPPPRTGGLSVTASVPSAEVFLEDQPRGATPLELRGLPIGRYRLELRSPGYATWQGSVEVRAGERSSLRIELSPTAPRDGPSAFFQALRLRTWAVGGVALGCLISAAAVGAHLLAVQHDMDALPGVTLEEISRMEELRARGERDAWAANVLLGIGSAALLTTALLSYLDYRRSQSARPRVRAWRGPGATGLSFSF